MLKRLRIYMQLFYDLWKSTKINTAIIEQDSTYSVNAEALMRVLGIPQSILVDIRLGSIPEFCELNQTSQTIIISTQHKLKSPARATKRLRAVQ